MPCYRAYHVTNGWGGNPNLWTVGRENDTVTVYSVMGLVIWQMPDTGQNDDEAIQEAIISTLVEDWKGERDVTS